MGILDTTCSKLKCEKMYSTWEYYNSCLIDTFLVSVLVIVWLVGWLVSLLVVDWLVLFVLVAVLWLLEMFIMSIKCMYYEGGGYVKNCGVWE